MDALVLNLEIRRDTAGSGRRNAYSPTVTILAFDNEGLGSRQTLAELANLPGLVRDKP